MRRGRVLKAAIGSSGTFPKRAGPALRGASSVIAPARQETTCSAVCTPSHPDHGTQQQGGTMPYVDGFVLPVPTRRLAVYRKMAAKAGRIWMEYGALEFRECVGEDLRA